MSASITVPEPLSIDDAALSGASPPTSGLEASALGAHHETVPAPPESRVAQAWNVLGTVLDPEVPALSVVDLGIVRDVRDVRDVGDVGDVGDGRKTLE
ncbi:MAG: Phenylacetate-CoA oxygenase subunit PaaJ, partial [Rhizobacter sp.]|nr:Phenylacetate-CoA oxygenase subunit PaaJ [Rhizobacter sp.]